ncbi:MAG: RAD55 family ATPase [Candidatus Nanohaloarchaea archaeon]
MSENKVPRTKTGVNGLDEILNGGIPQGHTTVVSGTSGSGKTTLTTEFLYYGAKEYDEKGIYFTLEEPAENIIETSKHFGMDFESDEVKDKVRFFEELNLLRSGSSGEVFEPDRFVEEFKRQIEEFEPDRVVLDSITKFAMIFDSAALRREKVSELAEFLREHGCTTCLLSEIPYSSGKRQVSRYQIVEFVADGVILLGYERSKSSRTRTIEVFKMRRTDHSSDIHPLRITDDGMTTYPGQTAF